MKKLLKKLIPERLLYIYRSIKTNYFLRHAIKSYSQEGEDMILKRIFSAKKTGYYVDVGAHHPFRFSNTFYFYKRGWRGINIDAMPGSMKIFKKLRPRDINLEVPIGSSDKMITYFSFNEPALNGFSEELSRERDGRNGYFINNEIQMKPSKLSEILDEFLPKKQNIDFLTIDVEGLDFDILKSNDWTKYQPSCILIEILSSSLNDIDKNEISSYLKNKGYTLYSKAVNTVIFMHKNFY